MSTRQYNPLSDYIVEGSGPPLLLIHGWPFHQHSFRKIVPLLRDHVTCYMPNSMGMSDTGFDIEDGFGFYDHARRAIAFADHLGLKRFSILGHDTGGTIARIMAAENPERIEKLILLNTEMPNHRPPFIPLYGALSKLPASAFMFSKVVPLPAYRNSRLGFGGCFYDKSHIDKAFIKLFVDHWFRPAARTPGLLKYLQGIDFKIVDDLPNIHARIKAPIRMIWGQDDVTFPVKHARKMAKTMPTLERLIEVENACFLLHEERPAIVAQHILEFLHSPPRA